MANTALTATICHAYRPCAQAFRTDLRERTLVPAAGILDEPHDYYAEKHGDEYDDGESNGPKSSKGLGSGRGL